VSLPEVPLLGVLPGTGGLTRVTDKRRVRHDLADIFCTSTEGVRGQRAVDWRLVDAVAKPAQFPAAVQERASQLAGQRPPSGEAARAWRSPAGAHRQRRRHQPTRTSNVQIDRSKRTATITIKAPTGAQPADIAAIEAAGAAWWPLAMCRELDDAILNLRTNELDIGTWLLKTEGDAAAVLASDAVMFAHKDHWLVRETIGALRRTLARLDVSSRSLFALVEPAPASPARWPSWPSPPTAPTCSRCPTTPGAHRSSRWARPTSATSRW
jgi:benzoyl-CoA-dihydrodiol lyase